VIVCAAAGIDGAGPGRAGEAPERWPVAGCGEPLNQTVPLLSAETSHGENPAPSFHTVDWTSVVSGSGTILMIAFAPGPLNDP